ncbi:hypothetical protein [Beijerinckia sp. L45]|uniref:hypothetical protein n=1 Tax=Beijerinckia sp. L45 TaxID=1641855 RepID=UPI00131B6C02|nr:hypothetical protein [Beijerinckia sp. L45]
MLFSLQEDHGSSINVYVVPDSGGTVPSIRVRSEGVELATLSANVTIDALVHAGRHSTGRCGFAIDDSHVPNLAGHNDLEIVEAETDILVYRRAMPDRLPDINLFRFETHLLPLWRIDDALKSRFQYWYKGIDRFGRETSTQVFCLNNGTSSYVSGRLLYKNYEFYLSKGIKTVAMMRDPYDELAERLILLKNIGTRAEEVLGARDAITFAPVIESLAESEDFDETFCKRFFKKASDEVLMALANPIVRQLTASTPDELPNHASVAAALDVLSTFELIGRRTESADFNTGLAELLGVPDAAIPQVPEYARVTDLGARLRGNPSIEAFLEKDLELFHFLAKAFTSAGR